MIDQGVMPENLKGYLKLFFFDRVGLGLVAFNAILLIFGALEKGDQFRFFHFYYEPWPIKIFTIINLPAIFVAEGFEQLISSAEPQGSMVRLSDLALFLIGFFSVLQWLIIGALFRIKSRRS